MMANSVELIEEHCFVSEAERRLLLSGPRPIVLLKKKARLKHRASGSAGREQSWIHAAVRTASLSASEQS